MIFHLIKTINFIVIFSFLPRCAYLNCMLPYFFLFSFFLSFFFLSLFLFSIHSYLLFGCLLIFILSKI